VGRRGSHRRGGEEVLHRGNGPPALPYAAGGLHGHVGTVRPVWYATTRPNAQILFDRFHIVKHLNEAVEEVRRSEMRRLSAKERVVFKRSRWLLLKNPWNLNSGEQDRLSTLVQWNTPIVRAYYLKKSFNYSGTINNRPGQSPHQEVEHSAMRSRLEPFKKIRADAAQPSGWNPAVDNLPTLQWRRGGNEQQDQIHQPSLVRIPLRRELHRGHLPTAAPGCRYPSNANHTFGTGAQIVVGYKSFLLPEVVMQFAMLGSQV